MPRRKVKVLFGGSTSERQVSLMSGTNVWLKLRSFEDLDVEPFLLAPSREGSEHESAAAREVWELPYAAVLRHTVEEVVEGCESAVENVTRVNHLRGEVMSDLDTAFNGAPLGSIRPLEPRRLLLRDFIEAAKTESATVFLAVHGGIGEDGTIQETLEEARVPHTGSDAAASRICMDKYATAQAIAHVSLVDFFAHCPKGSFTCLSCTALPKDLMSKHGFFD